MKIRRISSINLKRIVDNLGWLFLDKCIRLLGGLLVGVWVARYLGVERFGDLNYALSFVAIFAALASLGLNGVVVRDLVRKPDASNSILGSSFFLLMAGGVASFALMMACVEFVHPASNETKWLVFIIGAGILFKSFDVVRFWYEAKVSSRIVVWADNVVFLMFSALKVALIMAGAGVLGFAVAAFLEMVCMAAGLIAVYLWFGRQKISSWRIDKATVTGLLKESWPLALSVFAIVVYTRIDQIMIGQMLGNQAVGEYAAALRISEVWYFVPAIVTATAFPMILGVKQKDRFEYAKRFQLLYDALVVFAVVIGVVLTFSSELLMRTLYGNSYAGGAGVLVVLSWTGVFVALNTVSGRWLISEGLSRYALMRNLIGAFLNIGLNLILIPKFGIAGAAMATLISYCSAAYMFDGFAPPTRQMFMQKTKSLMLFGALMRLRNEFLKLILGVQKK